MLTLVYQNKDFYSINNTDFNTLKLALAQLSVENKPNLWQIKCYFIEIFCQYLY